MTRHKILPFQHSMLRKKCSRIRKYDKSIYQLIEDLIETMDAYGGIGLAAPQIGRPLKVLVVRVNDVLMTLMNAEIVHENGSEIDEEGCLSLPLYYGKVERASRVTVKSMAENGKMVKHKAEGILARALQHEIDHTNGVLFTDRLVEGSDLRYVGTDDVDYERSV